MKTFCSRMLGSGAAILVGLIISQPAFAQVQGTLFMKQGSPLTGSLSFRGGSKSYQITQGSMIMTKAASDVLKVSVSTPPGFDEAVKNVKAGKNLDVSIGTLSKIADEYTMLEYDTKAARWLADAYFQKNMVDKVLVNCEKIIESNAEAAYSGDMAEMYWRALLKTDKVSKLKGLLSDAVSKGSRETAARALIMRGDIEMKNNDYQAALIDGYLMVVVMFQDVKDVQPEALEKAGKAFTQRGQVAYTEKMTRKLLSDYPDSPEAKKISSK